MDLIGLIDQAHRALTVLAAACAGGVLVLAPAGAIVSRPDQPLPARARAAIDALVVIVPLLVAASAVVGLVLFVASGGPRDGLHAVYGAVALFALPLARILGAGPPVDPKADPGDLPVPATDELTGRLAIWLGVGALITLGALLRLAGTG